MRHIRRPSGLLILLLAFVPLATVTPSLAQPVLVTTAGGGPDNVPGPSANLASPASVIVSPTGELYLSVMDAGRVYRLDAAGRLRVVAGSGTGLACPAAFTQDGLRAVDACLNGPTGLAMDKQGNLFIAETQGQTVRRVDAATGLIALVAGGTSGYFGEGIPATRAAMNHPSGVAVDRAGNLFIADRDNHRIRRVDAVTGFIATVVGNGVVTGSLDGEGSNPADDLGDGGPAGLATVSEPYGLAFDSAGNLFIADTGNNRVRRVDAATGTISTVAGNGSFGYMEDGVPATSTSLTGPSQLAFDPAGNLLIADSDDRAVVPPGDDFYNHKVRRVDRNTGVITTVAGGGRGFFGDGGPAVDAGLFLPTGVASDAAGNIYIADQLNLRIRKVEPAGGLITTIADNGVPDFSGDGGAAAKAGTTQTSHVAVDPADRLYFIDFQNHRVRRVDLATGVVTTVAGNGSAVHGGDGGPATSAGLECPSGLAVDSSYNVFISDFCVHRVRKVSAATGVITTVAGTGVAGYGGDGGPATSALLYFPSYLAANASGDLFIADEGNNRVRRVRASNGNIGTVAGNGVETDSIDGPGGDPSDDYKEGVPATNASLAFPEGIAIDATGNIYFADWGNNRIRKVQASGGNIVTVAGNGLSSFNGEAIPALDAAIAPADVRLDTAGNIYFADDQNRRIRLVDAGTGLVTTLVGGGAAPYTGDGALALGAGLGPLSGLALDSAGNVHLADGYNKRVRRLATVPPGVSAVPDGSAAQDRPLTVTRAPNGDLSLVWGASCGSSDNDYAVYEGAIGDFTSHAPLFCSTGGATAKTFTPGGGDTYYLVVARNGAREGSYGLRSNGAERPPSTAACAPQKIATQCQ